MQFKYKEVMKVITSTSNAEIKQWKLLSEKASERKKTGLFIIEGQREIMLAAKAGYDIQDIFFNAQIIPLNALQSWLKAINPLLLPDLTEVSPPVYEKLAYRENSGGVIALCRAKKSGLETLEITDNMFIVVLENVEKPGNLGAILRTCDAAGVDAVMVCDMQTDLMNPNTIRSSLGSVFSNKVITCKSNEAITFLKTQQIKIVVTHLEAALPFHEVSYKGSIALVFGSEADGVTAIWSNAADSRIIIPMWGSVNSMNVSVSAGIAIYEAIKQRKLVKI